MPVIYKKSLPRQGLALAPGLRMGVGILKGQHKEVEKRDGYREL